MDAFDDRPVLRDPELNSRLLRDGYVRLDNEALDRVQRDRLRAFFLARYPGRRDHAFNNDFFVDDPEYRAAGTEVMADVTEGLCNRYFAGYEPFLYTYLVKFAGSQTTIAEHRDWMYVDELRGDRSYILYVAVDEVSEAVGGLHVVPRSHLLDGPPCGTRLHWPWLGYTEVLRRHAVRLDLKPGEAAIWDNRLIHMSFDNHTPSARCAVGLWCHRRGGQLSHFFRPEAEEIVRHYQVDELFYMTETPTLLAQRAPGWPVLEELPLEPFEHSEDLLEMVLSGSRSQGTSPA